MYSSSCALGLSGHLRFFLQAPHEGPDRWFREPEGLAMESFQKRERDRRKRQKRREKADRRKDRAEAKRRGGSEIRPALPEAAPDAAASTSSTPAPLERTTP